MPASVDRPGFARLAACLHEAGVNTIHGLMGEANADFIACAVERHGMRFISTRHEGGAVGMAEGAARASGRVQVATVTYGPGLTNSLTAITTAARNRAQVLLVTGQRAPGAMSRNQYVDQTEMLAPTGAAVFHVRRPADVELATGRATSFIRERSLPAVLVLSPLVAEDDAAQPAIDFADDILPPQARPPSPIDHAAVGQFAKILSDAQKGVILAGRGAILSGAIGVLAELADRTGAALMTTLLAKGAFSGNPRDRGIAGGFGDEGGAETLREADVVAVFGASLSIWTTRMGKGFPQARLIRCDIDPAGVTGSTPRQELTIAHDARTLATALLDLLPPECVRYAPAPAVHHAPPLRSAAPLDPAAVCDALDRILPAERTVVLDAGHFFEYPSRHLKVPDARGFIFTAGFGSIGLGLATAIGAALGRPDRLAVAVVGDGGFLMSIAELETAVRYKLPLLVVVLNDEAYGAEVKLLEHRGWQADLARFRNPDLASLARSFGARAASVASLDDLRALPLDQPLDGPLVLDVRIDPQATAHWVHLARGEA